MCGLCGVLHLDGAPADLATLDAMNACLAHRGPDQGRSLALGACGLASRRLAVLDLSPAAALPMRSADGAIAVAYNGEIYNHLELRPALEARGHSFRTTSDVETLIALYREHGPRCVERLRGMFAFALWDAPRGRLVLARDRLGKKPLYLYRDARRLAFASEIKALLRDPGVPRRFDRAQLALLLAYGYVPAPQTAFEGITMLPPGALLIVEDAAITEEVYWSPPPGAPADPAARLEDWIEPLRAALDEAVQLRLLSDVPLGAFLSGGLDSSLIVALMARHSGEPVKTFAIGFSGEDSFDETAHARRVATLLGTEHREFIVQPDAIALLPFLVWHHDQPFADSSAIPTYLVSQHTRAHVTVALSGDGGDELFAGYERFYAASLVARYRRLPGALRRAIEWAADRLPEATSYRGPAQRVRRFVSGAALSPEAAYFSFVRLFDDAQIAALLGGAPDPGPTAHFLARIPHDDRDLTARLLDANLTTYLPDDLLIKADRSSMAASLETRAPFLDHMLVELAARVPANLKLRGATTKAVLKEAARGVLPDDIIDRPKHGFGVPVGRWFRKDLALYAREILLDPAAQARGLFRPGAVEALLDEHIGGRRNHGQRIWLLLTLEWWFRLFIDAAEPVAPPEPSP